MRKNDEILSYEDKYLQNAKGDKSSGMASLARQIPAGIADSVKQKLESIAKDAFLALNVQGIIRIDFMLVNDTVYLNEVNNIPGSLAFYLWEPKGVSYTELLNSLIEEAINIFFAKKQKTFSIDTNVLAIKGSKNGK